MGGGLDDLAADQLRGRLYYSFLALLTEYLEKKEEDEKLLKQVIEAAKDTDSVRPGIWGGQTYLSEDLENKIKLLKEKDRTEWARLLTETSSETFFYERLKAISPFTDKLCIHVDYNSRSTTITGRELEKFFTDLAKQRGWKMHNHDKYVLLISANEILNLTTIEMFRIN